MKIRIILSVLCIVMLCNKSRAQTDSEQASQKAITVASKLINSFKFAEWDQYLAMSYPGVVKYYGGRTGYLNYVQAFRNRYKDSLQENPETVRILQIENDVMEWQCVVEKVRETYFNGRRGKVISYLVGQSKDDGNNWQFFDVAQNSVENVIYIMPDIFSNLTIPQRTIKLESDFGYDQKRASNKSSASTRD